MRRNEEDGGKREKAMRLGMTFLKRGSERLIVECGYPYIKVFWGVKRNFQSSHASFCPKHHVL